MQVTMLKTLAGKHGLMRTGTTVTVDDRYGKYLIKSGFAVEKKFEERKPDTNKDLGGAPHTKDGDGEGNDESSGSDAQGGSESSQDRDTSKEDDDSAAPPDAGKAKPVSSRQVGRRSRKRT